MAASWDSNSTRIHAKSVSRERFPGSSKILKKGATIDYNNATLVASWPQCTHLHFFISLDSTWIWLLNSAAPYLCQHCLTYFSQVHKKRLHSCRGESCRNHFGCSLQRNSSGWSQWSPCTLLFHYIPAFSGSLTVYHSWTVRLCMTCSHMAQATEHGSWRCSSAF